MQEEKQFTCLTHAQNISRGYKSEGSEAGSHEA